MGMLVAPAVLHQARHQAFDTGGGCLLRSVRQQPLLMECNGKSRRTTHSPPRLLPRGGEAPAPIVKSGQVGQKLTQRRSCTAKGQKESIPVGLGGGHAEVQPRRALVPTPGWKVLWRQGGTVAQICHPDHGPEEGGGRHAEVQPRWALVPTPGLQALAAGWDAGPFPP